MTLSAFPKKSIGTIFYFISNTRFEILTLLLIYKFTTHATNGIWYGDFWEHSAVIQALMIDLSNPSHPFFAIQSPHAFISPYHWIAALLAKYSGLGAINTLSLLGILNFCLFIFGLKVFIQGFELRVPRFTCFYTLLFILFLWGNEPWGFSGFFHFELIADILPYPSTFSTALSLIGLGLGFQLLRSESIIRYLLLILISTLVLLSHPLTFIFLASGLLCQAVTSKEIFSAITKRVTVFVLAIGIAMLWPYYSIFALLTGAGDVYHASNRSMYTDVLIKIWPILVLSPLLWLALKNKATHPIFLHLLALILVYFFGWFTGKYSYGRDITFIVILVQILLASQFAYFEMQLSQSFPRSILTYRVSLGVILLCLASSWLYPTFTRSLTVLNSLVSGRTVSNQHMYKNLTFLPQYIEKGSVVLSDIDTSWLIPSFGGKVIGALHVQAFVADDAQRRVDLIDFFSKDATPARRQALIQKYKPEYFLINKHATKDWRELLNEIESFSKMTRVYENEQYLLFRFN
jgi:hypothetical protein